MDSTPSNARVSFNKSDSLTTIVGVTMDVKPAISGTHVGKLMNVKPKSSGIHIAKLINLVRPHEPLYNPRHCQFRDKTYTSAVWKLISKELGATANEAKNKWQNLRSNFMRERRRVLRSNGSAHIPWAYYKKLLFLESFLKFDLNGAVSSSKQLDSSDPENSFLTDEVFEPTVIRIDDCSNMKPEYTFEPVSDNDASSEAGTSCEGSAKRRRNAREYEETIVTTQDPLQIGNYSSLAEDPDLSFFRGLLPHIKQLGTMENLAFKSEVVQILERKLMSSE